MNMFSLLSPFLSIEKRKRESEKVRREGERIDREKRRGEGKTEGR